MAERTKKAEEIRKSILQEVFENAGKVDVKQLAQLYNVTPKTIYGHIRQMTDVDKVIHKRKKGRNNILALVPLDHFIRIYPCDNLEEDIVLKNDCLPFLGNIPSVAKNVFAYVFSEMLNNAIEHSNATKILVYLEKNAYTVGCQIRDNGVGIFEKISRALDLPEKKFAVLELAKGKFTTEPDSHTGEGIFFSSKTADQFFIASDGIAFFGAHSEEEPECVIDAPEATGFGSTGTCVFFDIVLDRTTSAGDIMNRYTQHPDDYGFSKTVVPVKLLEYREANPIFISRSQAKRLYARFERFSNVILDFQDVPEIGQGFADELFRVFKNSHPDCNLDYTHANPKVEAMIRHVLQS
jgi:histidine kinase-related ATPase, putative